MLQFIWFINECCATCKFYYVFKRQERKSLLNLLIKSKGRCFIWSSCTFTLTLFSSSSYNKVQAAPLIMSLSQRALHSKHRSVSSVLINDKALNLEDWWLTELLFPLWRRDSMIKYGSSNMKDWLLPLEMDCWEVIRAGSHSGRFLFLFFLNDASLII